MIFSDSGRKVKEGEENCDEELPKRTKRTMSAPSSVAKKRKSSGSSAPTVKSPSVGDDPLEEGGEDFCAALLCTATLGEGEEEEKKPETPKRAGSKAAQKKRSLNSGPQKSKNQANASAANKPTSIMINNKMVNIGEFLKTGHKISSPQKNKPKSN